MKYEALFNRVKVPTIDCIETFDHSFGFIGSCFSSHMHDRFRRVGLSAWLSPYGTTYNPISIENQLIASVDMNYAFNLKQDGDTYFYWETSHQHVCSSETELMESVGALRKDTEKQLQSMNTLFITLGSAWVYETMDTGQLVANCHKVPQVNFKKRLLSIAEIIESLERIVILLNRHNPFLKLVLTVSPVRHIREGLIENNRSKARLIEACQCVCEGPFSPHYFPTYELIIDELRDYRFFESDGVHPNALAVDFVWDRLKESLFNPSMEPLFKAVSSIRQQEAHRFITHEVSKQKEQVKKIEEQKTNLSLTHNIHW